VSDAAPQEGQRHSTCGPKASPDPDPLDRPTRNQSTTPTPPTAAHLESCGEEQARDDEREQERCDERCGTVSPSQLRAWIVICRVH